MNLTTAQALLQQKSTPFYVFDMPELRRRIHDLRESLPGHVKTLLRRKSQHIYPRRSCPLGRPAGDLFPRRASPSARNCSFRPKNSWSPAFTKNPD